MLLDYDFLRKLQDIQSVEKILLFGSRADGTNRERSDIDLAIFCPEATFDDWQKVLEIIDNADTLLEIDCVRLDALSDKSPLKTSILKTNVLLYQKRRNDGKL